MSSDTYFECIKRKIFSNTRKNTIISLWILDDTKKKGDLSLESYHELVPLTI